MKKKEKIKYSLGMSVANANLLLIFLNLWNPMLHHITSTCEKIYYFCNIKRSFWNGKAIFYFFSLFFCLSFSLIQCLLQNSDITCGSYYDEQQHLGLPIFRIHKWATAWRCINLRFLNFTLLLASIGYFVDFSFASLIKTGFSSWCCCHWVCCLFLLLQRKSALYAAFWTNRI